MRFRRMSCWHNLPGGLWSAYLPTCCTLLADLWVSCRSPNSLYVSTTHPAMLAANSSTHSPYSIEDTGLHELTFLLAKTFRCKAKVAESCRAYHVQVNGFLVPILSSSWSGVGD